MLAVLCTRVPLKVGDLLKYAVACGIGGLLVSVLFVATAQAQSEVTATHMDVTAEDLQRRGKAATGIVVDKTVRLKAGPRMGTILSPPIEVPFAFSAVGPHWGAHVPDGAALDVAVRTSADGRAWTRWTPTAHHEPVEPQRPDGTSNPYAGDTAADPVLAPPDSRYVQFRLTLRRGATSPALERLSLYVAAVEGSVSRPEKTEREAEPQIYTRDEWGAQPPSASYRYARATHLAMHHTASTTAGAADTWEACAAAVQAIQDYHMNTRGWIDIGYNYLICQTGDIFQGREDGNDQRDVVGAHDAHNEGSVGVSGLGYFHPPHDQQPTSALIDGFTEMFTWIAERRAIDPEGVSYYAGYGASVANVYGHRDVRATACPGDHLYAERSVIVRRMAERIDIDEPPAMAASANYPNPFRTRTRFEVTLAHPTTVTLEVYDALGRHVTTRRFGQMETGTHVLALHPDGWASGAYFYRLTAGEHVYTGSMRLVR